MKIGFVCLRGLDTFIKPVIDRIRLQVDVDLILVDALTKEHFMNVRRRLTDRDVIFMEWANESTIIITQNMPDLLRDKKVIVRCHSYEVLNGMIKQVDFTHVDDIIFVAYHVERHAHSLFQGTVPWDSPDGTRLHIIPNGVDTGKFKLTLHSHGPNISHLGHMSDKKGPMLLAQAANVLPGMKFHLGGDWQDERYSAYIKYHQLRGLCSNINVHGHISNVNKWYQDKNFAICTSPWESQNMSIMEAMACGVMPLIHDFPGSREIYPSAYIWSSLSDLLRLIENAKNDYDSRRYRDFVESSYNAFQLVEQVVDVIKLERSVKGTGAEITETVVDIASKPSEKKEDVPKICAVIAHKNGTSGDHTIYDAVDSLLEQTVPVDEIIIVDDNSDQRHRQDLMETVKRNYGDNVTTIFSARTNWIHRSRNDGALRGSQKGCNYLMFLDHDDTIHPNYVETSLKILKENPDVNFVYPKMVYVDEDGDTNTFVAPQYSREELSVRNYVCYGSFMRMKAFWGVNGFDPYLNDCRNHLCEWHLWLRMGKGAPNNETSFYYSVSSSGSHSNWIRSRMDMVAQMAYRMGSRDPVKKNENKRILFVAKGVDKYAPIDTSFEFGTWIQPLQEYGDVFCYFYDVAIQCGIDPNEDLKAFTKYIQPDIVFHPAYKYDIGIETWKDIPGIKIVWMSDDNWRFVDYGSRYCKHFDYVITTYPKYVQLYNSMGKHCICSQWAANGNLFYDRGMFRQFDIAFVGARYAERKATLDLIEETFPDANIFFGGRDIGPYLTMQKMAEIYASSKIVINFAAGANGAPQIKCRLFEASACGALVFQEEAPGLSDLFSKDEIVTFGSLATKRGENELVEKLKIAQREIKWVKSTAERQHKRTLECHMWKNRFDVIFEYIEKNQVRNVYDDDFHARHLNYKDIYDYIAKVIGIHINPASAVDYGCGIGLLLNALDKLQVNVAGFESSQNAIRHTPQSVVDKIHHTPLLAWKKVSEVVDPADEKTSLAVCMEVGEHIDDNEIELLVSRFDGADMVWFTAAPPGQYGEGHINCQPASYWVDQFKLFGFEPDWVFTYKMKLELQKNQRIVLGYPWFRDNLIIFRRKE